MSYNKTNWTDLTTPASADNMNKIEQGISDNDLNKMDNSQGNILCPPGAVMQFAMVTVPGGWLKCNGALISRTTYSSLFTAIGTIFGAGDGSTTFGLPDLRGEFIRGFDDSRGIDTSRVFGSTQTDDFKAHTHGIGFGGNLIAGASSNISAGAGTSLAATASVGGTETRPKNVALLYCIKY